jgi:CyaY protein
MNDTEFTQLADAELARIASAIDRAGIECDCSLRQDGVLDIELDQGGKIIVNRHAAAREIWVAARSGGFHFRHDGRAWVDTRDGTELSALLSRVLSELSGQAVDIGPESRRGG